MCRVESERKGLFQALLIEIRPILTAMPRSSRLSDKYAPILKEAKKATILNGIISVAACQAEGHGASDQAKNKFASVLKVLRVLSLLIDRGEIIYGFGGDSRTLL